METVVVVVAFLPWQKENVAFATDVGKAKLFRQFMCSGPVKKRSNDNPWKTLFYSFPILKVFALDFMMTGTMGRGRRRESFAVLFFFRLLGRILRSAKMSVLVKFFGHVVYRILRAATEY